MTPRSAAAALGRPPSSRLAFRLALILSLGAAVILITAGAWNLATQRSQLTLLVEEQASTVVETIRRATHDSMLRNDSAELARILDSLAAHEEIDRVRVFDKQGRITHSSARVEIGRQVDLSAEQCVSCHVAGQALSSPAGPQRTRVFERPGSGRTLAMIAPLHNEPACSNAACHAHEASQTVLGVLDVQLPLARVDAALAESQRQLLTGLAATVIAVVLLAFLLTWALVLRPVGFLTAAAPRLAAGDFAGRVPEHWSGELGGLSRAWNRMAADLGNAHAELEAWGRRLEERIEEKTQELEATHQGLLRVEKMASLGKLAASVAHELNNPLAGIATYARLLRRRRDEARSTGEPITPGASGMDIDRILELVESESRRCGDIVRNLLLFSRTPGALFSETKLAPIVERCVLLVRHQAELAGIDLRVDLPRELPPLECDAAQIQQALLALLVNALEATPEGGEVKISAAHDLRGRIRVAISDTGRGIPPEIQGHLFEPFFTTKTQGNGVGLGLAVVYGIIERHGGRILVDSEAGTGATFTLDLPLHQAAPPEPATVEQGRTP